jgi:hypothetical protein
MRFDPSGANNGGLALSCRLSATLRLSWTFDARPSPLLKSRKPVRLRYPRADAHLIRAHVQIRPPSLQFTDGVVDQVPMSATGATSGRVARPPRRSPEASTGRHAANKPFSLIARRPAVVVLTGQLAHSPPGGQPQPGSISSQSSGLRPPMPPGSRSRNCLMVRRSCSSFDGRHQSGRGHLGNSPHPGAPPASEEGLGQVGRRARSGACPGRPAPGP